MALIFAALTLSAGISWAQEAGVVVDVEGTVEIGRGGAWTPVTIGTAVALHDEIRTGTPGRLRVVLRDQSVLNVGDDSHLGISEQVFDPDRGAFRTLIRLYKGKMRPVVSTYYQRPGAAYEVESATAVAGVHGTEFVITYDPVADVTQVAGVTGRIEVHSVMDLVGRGVFITAQSLTTVARGQFPTASQRLPDKLFRQYLEGLEFIGSGRPESLSAGSPLLAGALVPPADRPEALPAPPIAAARGIVPTLPGEPPYQPPHTVVSQPPRFVTTTGNLGINF